jgi:hypothetical protein
VSLERAVDVFFLISGPLYFFKVAILPSQHWRGISLSLSAFGACLELAFPTSIFEARL